MSTATVDILDKPLLFLTNNYENIKYCGLKFFYLEIILEKA
jgi:hypothetical protein